MIRYLMCILLLLSVVISGCGKTDKITETAAETQNYTVHDIRGKKITFAKKPERIASSFVYADEILLDLVDHQKIVGLSKWVHDPGLSMGHKQAEDVPGIVENNLESVIALKPDLFFIADTAKKEYIDSLEDAGIKVYVFKYISRLDEIPDLIKGIGEAVGEKEKAETLIKTMNIKINAVKTKVAAIPQKQRKTGLLFLRFGAIGGAALACVLIYLLAWRDGIDTVRIILSGVAINTVLGAYNSFLQLLNSDNLSSVLSFMNGSLSGRSWDHVYIITVYAFIGLVLGVCCIKNANILQLGDEMAQSLGVNVTFVRIFLSAVAAFLAAATVAEAGMIGFVGLVVPHIARMMVGSDYKALLPVSMLLGAVILLAADTLGRTLIPGMEIPVGIVMAVTGGPFFLYMLRKKGKVSGS